MEGDSSPVSETDREVLAAAPGAQEMAALHPGG